MPTIERDVSIYYVHQGRGEPVFFCHGAGGNAASWWQQFGAFAQTHHCIAHDHRCFGRSGGGAAAFRVQEFAGDALAVLDALELESAHWVCQSMGGWTGVRVALEHPGRVRSLVLSGTIGGFALPSGVRSAAEVDRRIAETGAISPAIAADYPRRNPAGAFLYTQISALNREFANLDLMGTLFAEDTLIPLQRAKELRMPVLMFSGADDLFWPPSVLHELSTHIPGARIVDVDSGHSPYFENPDAFNECLRGFLENVD